MSWWQDPKFWANAWFISEWLIRVIMLAVVPMKRTPDAAKGWLLFIFALPLPGLITYMILGSNRLPQWRVEQQERVPDVFDEAIKRVRHDRHVIIPDLGPDFEQSVKLAQSLGHFPSMAGNTGELLSDYGDALKRLVDDIDEAEHHVHLLYYIFAVDETTQPIIDALARAVNRGVRCRVMVDRLGNGPYNRKLLPRLEKAGVQAVLMLPIGFWRRKAGRFDLRNHRKIAVIDGRVGYTGSQNLVAAKFKEGITYEEMVIRVTGPIVLELQFVFVSDWYVETDEVLSSEEIFPSPMLTGKLAMQALPSGPGFPLENNQRLIVSLIHAARKSVVITTPYFVPDEPLLQAMQTAVLRGVEVQLVVSEKEDQLLVSLAQKSYYSELLDAGVTIHLYRHKFLHAKHLSVDDSVAVIGSSNMDIRSFSLNAEIMLVIYDEGLASKLRVEQLRYHENCQELKLETWQERSRVKKLVENMARLVSPLL